MAKKKINIRNQNHDYYFPLRLASTIIWVQGENLKKLGLQKNTFEQIAILRLLANSYKNQILLANYLQLERRG
jgi:hypothetical protein